jgi:MFS family permease
MSTLSRPLQEQGRKNYLLFNRLNGLSFACLIENVLILYALKTGLPAYLTGILASFAFLAMPFMVFGKLLVGRLGAARTIRFSWTTRNLLMLIIALAPLAASHGAPRFLIGGMIMVPSFLFFAFRSMGMIAFNPLVGEITTRQTRGRFTSQAVLYSFISYFVAMALQIVALSLHSETITFQIIILAGCLLGLLAGYIIGQVPETETPRVSARTPVWESTKKILSQGSFRRLLGAQSAGLSICMLVMPISMIALKKGYSIPDRDALCFAMIQIAGGVATSFCNGIVADRTGPRPLLILYASGLLGVCGMWLAAPAVFLWPYIAILFFIGGGCSVGIGISCSHYFLNIASDHDRVGGNLLLNAVTGLSAGIAGSVLASGALHLLQSNHGQGDLSLYKSYFGFAAVLSGLLMIAIIRLKPLQEWKIKQVLGLFASARDMRALFGLYRMEEKDSLDRDRRHVNQLAEIASEMSEEAMLDFLDSPSLSLRWQALRGLQHLKTLSPEAENALVSHIEDFPQTTAYMAAEIVGEKHLLAAIPVLRQSLEFPDVFLQGKAMLALARLGDRDSFPIIRRMFLGSDNPRILIHGAMAFAQMEDLTLIGDILHQFFSVPLSTTIRHELLLVAAEIVGCNDSFYQFAKIFRREPTAALSMILEQELPKLEQPQYARQLLCEAWKQDLVLTDSQQGHILELLSEPLRTIIRDCFNAAKPQSLPPAALAFMIFLANKKLPRDLAIPG